MAAFRLPIGALRSRARDALDALASLVFPAPCRVCDAVLDTAGRIPICAKCLGSFTPLAGPSCQVCGRPFISPQAATAINPLCHACRREVYDFDFARSYASYDETMIRAIMLLKYEGIAPLGNWFADRLKQVAAANQEGLAADVVVPVPLHPLRRRDRGYNQAELITRPLARKLGLPLRSFLLFRTKPRPAKLRLTRRERWETVRGAFAVHERACVDNLRVLLVDDVFTTGATLDACSQALRRAGASRVVCLTVARVVRDWAKPSPDW